MAEASKKRVRLSLDIEPELRRRLKIAAARRDLSLRDYAEAALRRALDAEEAVDQTEVCMEDERRLTAEEQQRGLLALAALEEIDRELLKKRGGRPFTPSRELLYESREERLRQLMGEE